MGKLFVLVSLLMFANSSLTHAAGKLAFEFSCDNGTLDQVTGLAFRAPLPAIKLDANGVAGSIDSNGFLTITKGSVSLIIGELNQNSRDSIALYCGEDDFKDIDFFRASLDLSQNLTIAEEMRFTSPDCGWKFNLNDWNSWEVVWTRPTEHKKTLKIADKAIELKASSRKVFKTKDECKQANDRTLSGKSKD